MNLLLTRMGHLDYAIVFDKAHFARLPAQVAVYRAALSLIAGVLFFGGDVPAWSFAAEAAGIAVMVWGGAKVRSGAVRPPGGAARRKGGAGG